MELDPYERRCAAAARRDAQEIERDRDRLAALLDEALAAKVALSAAFDRLAIEHGKAVAELAKPKLHGEPDMDRCG